MQRKNQSLELKISHLTTKLDKLMEFHGVKLDDETSSGLQKIMSEEENRVLTHNFKPGSF